MKTKSILLTLVIVVSVCVKFLNAQNVIALEHAGVTSIYTNLDSAMAHAVDNDIIYLPGGSFTPAGGLLSITKKLNIIGAGHYPDSTVATGQTIINGSIRINTGADGGSLQGVYITGNVYFGSNSSNNVVNGYSISRCYLASELILNYNTALNPLTQNIHISENVIIGIVYLADAQNLLFSKNIFQSYLRETNGQVVMRNNIFLNQTNYACSSMPTFHNFDGVIFYDNIIHNIGCSGIYTGSFTGNAFYNNLFCPNISFPLAGNPGTGNIVNQPIDSIYVTHTFGSFNYNNNYQLRPNCLGNNAGSDGTDMGLYGTTYPYKPGAVPINPHIQTKVIAPNTDSQGNLNINIRVGAQDR